MNTKTISRITRNHSRTIWIILFFPGANKKALLLLRLNMVKEFISTIMMVNVILIFHQD